MLAAQLFSMPGAKDATLFRAHAGKPPLGLMQPQFSGVLCLPRVSVHPCYAASVTNDFVRLFDGFDAMLTQISV